MSTLTLEARAQRAWVQGDDLWIALFDGRQMSIPLVFFPRLSKGTAEQRGRIEISGGGLGLHWEALDEDLHVPSLIAGKMGI